ncbi:MAG TPA: V-type ATP synthase subunit E family protein [Conexivisphaerales archaeon]|nr:V-type ATP synthase subunit E family protein [Conexivisphaerales archaeon]
MPSKEIEATVGKVLTEESASIKALLDEALASSLRVIDDFEQRASERYMESMLDGRKQAENVKRKVLGSAELQARNAQLSAFESFFEGIVIEALAAIKAVPREARYEKALVRLLNESLVELDRGDYTLSCPEADRAALAGAVKSVVKDFPGFNLTISKKPIEGAGGFVVVSRDGSVEYNSTFEARLERMKPSIRKRVYERFFKEIR